MRAPMTNGSVIDSESIEKLQQLFGDKFYILVEKYLEDVPNLISDMNIALANKDHEALFRAAHTLKSPSQQMGVNELAEVAIQLEELGRNSETANAEELIAKAKNIYEQAENLLQGFTQAKEQNG